MAVSIKNSRIFQYLASAAAIFLATAILEIFQGSVNPTTAALVFILIILCAATFFGRNPALLSSLAAMLCFN